MKIHDVNGFLILCRFLSFTHKRKFGEVRSCVLERATPGSSYTHTHTHTHTHTDNIHNCTYTYSHTKPHRHTDTYMITYTLTHSQIHSDTQTETHTLVHNS